MRLQIAAGTMLSLLLCACGAGTSNGNGEAAATDSSVTVPVGADQPAEAGVAPPPQGNDVPAGAASAGVTLTVSPEQATEDSTVTLTLRNDSVQQIGYNLCASGLMMANGREVPTSRVCTRQLGALEPGRTDTYRYKLPVNMAEGHYRFVAQVERMPSGGMQSVRSNSFTVRSD